MSAAATAARPKDRVNELEKNFMTVLDWVCFAATSFGFPMPMLTSSSTLVLRVASKSAP
jgi:hypothetical protein